MPPRLKKLTSYEFWRTGLGGRIPPAFDLVKSRRLAGLPVKSAPDWQALIQDILDPLIPENSQVALFDFPNYSNVGDSAIWLGEEAYLRRREDLSLTVVEDCGVRHRRLPELRPSAVVLIQGGGNLGDLWPHHQALRETIVGHYQNQRIIQLPQSIYFGEPINEERSRRIFGAHGDFHLLVRDQASLEWGQRLHDGPTQLCPDMALCLGPLSRTREPSHDIVALLRTDKETATSNGSREHMRDAVIADWLEEPSSLIRRITRRFERLQSEYPRRLASLYGIKRRLYHRLARERLQRGCDILSSGRVVITDRLHAHILCTLMDIPHVVLDNSYRKIGNFRDAWETGAGLCETASNLVEANSKAGKLLGAFPVGSAS